MINFAAPRLGNAAFKAWTETKLLNLSAWRFVYRQDAVPRVVLRIMGYVHAGHLWMLYKNSGKIYYRQVGDGSNYIGAPWNWYCKLNLSMRYHFTTVHKTSSQNMFFS